MFAGIGGFRLGLEPLGWQSVWANEIDPYACDIYRRNFGNKELAEGDIRNIDPNDIPEFDMLTGGFPCQDISSVGKREGITELNRSGLFYEIIRIASHCKPKWIYLENVSALLIRGRGMGIVQGELSKLGYNVEYDIIPASLIGAPQVRKRIWIIAYSKSLGLDSTIIQKEFDPKSISPFWGYVPNIFVDIVGNTYPEIPEYLRVDNGIPTGMDEIKQRIKCLGNAVVPQLVEFIGRQIQDAINKTQTKELHNVRKR